jgi:hypothetical protein
MLVFPQALPFICFFSKIHDVSPARHSKLRLISDAPFGAKHCAIRIQANLNVLRAEVWRIRHKVPLRFPEDKMSVFLSAYSHVTCKTDTF